ncbi:hypothetical protein [Escherichia coli]|uniref:hypothetical protein n=1 Tax=Escherichia coli TaxID=562 RepID=UPI000F893102|nr:hypothetical protein [Escherichia coli]
MAEKKYTTLRVPGKSRMEVEKAAIEVSYATGRMGKWTDMAFYLMDEYLKEAVRDMKSSTKTPSLGKK